LGGGILEKVNFKERNSRLEKEGGEKEGRKSTLSLPFREKPHKKNKSTQWRNPQGSKKGGKRQIESRT